MSEMVFRTEEDFAYFLQLLKRYRQRFAVCLYHYCLMPNHFHLLVRAEDPKELSPWMAGLLRTYVPYHHRRTGFVGHLWPRRFQRPAVAVEDYFLSCAGYIERNALLAGLVGLPWQYCWSCRPAYALGVADSPSSYNVWY